jgi:uncharacterized glyoxalase superfamily protein PhnB
MKALKALPDGWPRITSALIYDDARAAIDWLCRVFDFELRLLVETGDGGVAHCELVYGDGVIMVADPGAQPYFRSPSSAGGNTQTLMVYVDDIDAHCAKSRAAGATISTEPTVTEYGPEYWSDRSYGAVDCGGHNWWFTQRVATGNPEWSKVRDKIERSRSEPQK